MALRHKHPRTKVALTPEEERAGDSSPERQAGADCQSAARPGPDIEDIDLGDGQSAARRFIEKV